MDAQRISRKIPAIAERFQHTVLSKHWSMVSDPLEVVRGLAKAVESHGVIFNRSRVNSFSASLNAITLETNTGSCRHDADYLPMAAERGYNLTLPASGVALKLPLVFADRGIVATHLTGGLRIGGWAEYAHPNRPANQNYFKSLARISNELFPGLNLDNAAFWMGNRPSLPDPVPVISRSSHAHRVYYNCGHGHYGLTHAATSARLLCALVSAESSLPEHRAYLIGRFK